MAIIDPQPGQIINYHLDAVRKPLLAEIVEVGTPYAYLGGARMVTAVLRQTSADRCHRAGDAVRAYDRDDTWSRPTRQPATSLALPTATLYGCFRASGDLWDWYRLSTPWVAPSVQVVLNHFGKDHPGAASLFTERAMAEQYLAEVFEVSPADTQPGERVGEVTAKTWKSPESSRYVFARILIPAHLEKP